MWKDNKASVYSAYTTGNCTKQTVFPYPVIRAVVTSFSHTNLVYQRETASFLQVQLWEAIFFILHVTRMH